MSTAEKTRRELRLCIPLSKPNSPFSYYKTNAQQDTASVAGYGVTQPNHNSVLPDNNSHISIAPYGPNFGGAGGRSCHCQLNA